MDIAIVGLSLKLPNNIDNLDDLYDILKNKIDCISEHPKERFNNDFYFDKNNASAKINTNQGGYLSNIYDFDNEFFKISNKEAKTTDPQQRILLELVYEALQDANIQLESIKNTNTGVFVGSCNTEYFANQTEDPTLCNEYSVTGGLLTLLSNRISYFYDLKGPSMTIDTACSSSGHALHHACKSILSGETDTCIVGGSNLILNPETSVGFSQGHFLSPDGRCKSFDQSANGYIRSEGCVIFILKKLDQAIQDNNKIYAVIKQTSVNQDGKTNSITMPNQKQQQALLQQCYKDVNIDDVCYVEAHGTGTMLGDKIEANSIGRVLGKTRDISTGDLHIGSLKSVLGHTEATSGLASLCKMIVMMQKKELLPNLHFHTPSENIDFQDLRLHVVTETLPIEREHIVMGVNNYGFGGSNFHCVLENYVSDVDYDIGSEINSLEVDAQNKLHLLCVYGNNEESIGKNIFPFLEYEQNDFLKYVYNQNLSYKQDEAKIYIVENKEDFESNVFNPQENSELSCVYGSFHKRKPKIGFVFCGQGPQFINMGLEFMETFPAFRNKILECDSIWKSIAQFSFIEKYGMFIHNDAINYEQLPIHDPIVAQPSITFFQIALLELYASYGVCPEVVIGHSAGEQAAFYASGAISLYDTIHIAYYRSILQQKTAGKGNMLVVNQHIRTIDEILEKHSGLELAVINSVESYVLAGETNNIIALKNQLGEEQISCAIIKGNCPFHSSFQDIIKDDIVKHTQHIQCNNTHTELLSTTTGFTFDQSDYLQEYWWDNIRHVVQFHDVIDQCNNVDIFVEIAPHSVLETNIVTTLPNALVLASANRKENSARRFMATLSKLYFSGIDLDFTNIGISNKQCFPKYVWNKHTFMQKSVSTIERHHHIPHKLNHIRFHPKSYPYIYDHVIKNKAILPTVTYIDLIHTHLLENHNCISDFNIYDMYSIDDKHIDFDVKQSLGTDNHYEFISDNMKYLSFRLCDVSIDHARDLSLHDKCNKLLDSHIRLNKQQMVKILSNKNYNFKDSLHQFENGYLGHDSILIQLPYIANKNHGIYPPIMDAMLTSNMIMQGLTNNIQYLPGHIDNILYFHHNLCEPCYMYCEKVSETEHTLVCDSYLLNNNFEIIMKMENIVSRSVDGSNTKTYNIDFMAVDNGVEDDGVVEDDDGGKIDDYDLVTLKPEFHSIYHILKENKRAIYIIDISIHYEIVGFIRTCLNEIHFTSPILFHIVYHKNNQPSLLACLAMKKYSIVVSKHQELFFSNGRENENKDKYLLSQMKLQDYVIPNFYSNNYCLSYKHKGNVDNLMFQHVTPMPLEENEVRVYVKSCALNFKDISVIYDLIPDKYLGYELSGIISESRSTSFKKGDLVFGTNMNRPNHGIGNFVTCHEKDVFHHVSRFDFSQNASIGISYGTAYLALIHFATISSNDVVLIHSATGGLGIAAIEICKMIGCKVIATAGSKEKREYLQKYQHVVCISDSRCIETYKKDVMDFTDGKGVDVVLASTIQEFLEANLSLLKPCGKYLDVGKRQIYENHGLPLHYFINNIQYYSIHFDKLLVSNNNLIRNCMTSLCDLFEQEALELMPITRYSIEHMKDAFTCLSKSNHIGKIVLDIDETFYPETCLFPTTIFDHKKYYLITGGFGGLGMKLTEWMISYGARNFILTTRNYNEHNKQTIDHLIDKMKDDNKETNFVIFETDLMDYSYLSRFLSSYDIDGAFHLAGLIQDKMMENIFDGSSVDGSVDDSIDSIMNVKVKGLQHVSNYLQDKPHRFFVAFSSIVSLFGNPGQSIYSAANSYMDEFCRMRNQNDLPGLSICLGAIGGCGMIFNDFTLAETMMSNGIDFTIYFSLFEKMKHCLFDSKISNVCICDQDWNKLTNLKFVEPFIDYLQNDNHMLQIDIEQYQNDLISFLCKLIEMNVEDFDKTQNLISYGVDSIMSMEIANFCRDELSIPIRQIDILQGISVDDILRKNSNLVIKQNSDINNTNGNERKFIFKSNNGVSDDVVDEFDVMNEFSNSEKNNNYIVGFDHLLFFSILLWFFIYMYKVSLLTMFESIMHP